MSLLRWIQSSSKPTGNQPAQTPTTATLTNGTDKATSDGDIPAGADYKRFGMENFGNTCYCNSVLQALYFCQPFRELLLQASENSLPQQPAAQAINAAASTSLQPPKRTPVSSTAPAATKPALQSSTYTHKKQPSQGTSQDDTPETSTVPGGTAGDPLAASLIPGNPNTLSSALRSLYGHISGHSQSKGVVAPQAFVNKLKKENALFRSSMQQDAHEFLNFLLNKIVDDLEDESKVDQLSKSISSLTPSTSTSTDLSAASATVSSASVSPTPSPRHLPLIQSLFQGTLTNETRCLTCERVTSRSEPFLDLSLDIEQNSSVNACLRGFSKSEMLTAKNKFFCDECSGLVEAEKRMKIKTLPPVLLLHLKRFKYQEDTGRFIKLSYRVAFPMELRLYNNIIDGPDDGRPAKSGRKSTGGVIGVNGSSVGGLGLDGLDGEKKALEGPEGLYRLFAVVIHIGGGPNHGHYVTLVNSKDDTWLLFDDENVEVVKEADIPKYFGDPNFTVEGAVAAAAAAAAAASAAGASGVAASMMGMGASTVTATGVRGGAAASPSASTPSTTTSGANSNSSTGMNLAGLAFGSGAGMAAMSTMPATTGGATTNGTGGTGMPTGGMMNVSGTASGYVLFYQAVDIDLKALGLVTPPEVKKAEKIVPVPTANGAAVPIRIPTPTTPVGGSTSSDPTTVGPISVPTPDDGGDKGSGATPNQTGNGIVKSLTTKISVPSLSPGKHHHHHARTPSASSPTRSPTAPLPNFPSLTATTSSTPGAKTKRGMSLDIPQGSAPSLPSGESQGAVSPNGPSSGGLFKSLKHSSSAMIKSTSSPLASSSSNSHHHHHHLHIHPHPHASPSSSTAAGSASNPIPIVSYEKDKEKDKGWFSTARKSVRRSKKDKDKVTPVAIPYPPPLPSHHADSSTNVSTRTNTAFTDSSTLNNEQHPPGWSPNTSLGVEFSASASDSSTRRPSVPTVEEVPSPVAQSGGDASPTSDGRAPSTGALVEEPEELEFTFPSDSGHSARLPPSPSNKPNGLAPSGGARRSPTSPAAHLLTNHPAHPPPPQHPTHSDSPHRSRGPTKPRKSLTLLDPPTNPGTFLSTSPPTAPIPRPDKQSMLTPTGNHTEEYANGGSGGSTKLIKRASRKMSLTSGTIRLSGFGWGKDKDKTKE